MLTCVLKSLFKQPIWGWPSGWIWILKFVSLNVSGSILSDVNYGG